MMTMPKNTIKIIGQVQITCMNPDGSIVWDTGVMKNQITEAGIGEVVALAGDVGTPSPFEYLALGTDNTAPTDADTELGAEIMGSALERNIATKSREETTFPNDTLQLSYTWTAGGSETINEIGVFNDPSTGIMLGRLLTGARNVESGMIVSAVYKIILTID